jgi:hypothetical protein
LPSPEELPSPEYFSDYVEPPYVMIGNGATGVTRKPVGPRLPGTSTFSDTSISYKPVNRSSFELDNTARDHPLYHNVIPHADGLYHCPWENMPEGNCQHKPEKLKCNYEYDQIFFSHYLYLTLIISFLLANSWILTLSHIRAKSLLAKDSSSHLLFFSLAMSVRPTLCIGIAINPSSVLMKAVREV